MRAGTLRHTVTLEEAVETRDAVGGVVTTWQEVATVHAAKKGRSGREYYAAAQTQAEDLVEWQLRYRAGVVPKMRLVHGATVYDITAVLPDERHTRLTLMTRAQT